MSDIGTAYVNIVPKADGDKWRTADDGQKRRYDPDAERYALCRLPFRCRRNTGRSIHGSRYGLRKTGC